MTVSEEEDGEAERERDRQREEKGGGVMWHKWLKESEEEEGEGKRGVWLVLESKQVQRTEGGGEEGRGRQG